MKKLRILSLFAILLCVAMLFAACGKDAKTLTVKKAFDELKAEANPTPRLTAANKLEVTGTYVDDDGDLVLFSGTEGGYDKYTVYNVAKNSVVGTYTETETVAYNVDLYADDDPGYDLSYYVVQTATTDAAGKTTYKTALYAADGTKVAEVDKQNVALSLTFDLIRFDEKCYRISENGAIAEAFAWGEFAGNLPNIFAATEKYYYARLTTGTGFIVLDKSLQTVSSYVFASYAQNAVYGVLNNGDVWLQYQEKLPADAEKYDLVVEETGVANKYNLFQQVFDAKKGTVKDAKTEYLIQALVARDVAPEQDALKALDKSIDNVAIGYKIENQRASQTMQDMLFLSISNKGAVESILNRLVEGQVGFFEVPADGVLKISDILGRDYLYDAKGKLIGEITGAQAMTDTYVVGNSKIYDYNLNAVYDYTADGYEYYGTMRSAVILTKDNADGVAERYLYVNGNITKISEGATKVFNKVTDRLYYVRDYTAGTYTYYNDLGTQLLQIKGALSYETSRYNDAFIARYNNTETSTTEYYRFG